jgi:hypothetical protein
MADLYRNLVDFQTDEHFRDLLQRIHENTWDDDEEDDDKNKEEIELNDPVKSFFEAYDVEKFAMSVLTKMLTPILLKKHSERTEEERKIIKAIINFSKKEKPKIMIDRQEEDSDNEEVDLARNWLSDFSCTILR